MTALSGVTPPDSTSPANGSKLRGQLVYGVPKSMKSDTFVFQPDFVTGAQDNWSITL